MKNCVPCFSKIANAQQKDARRAVNATAIANVFVKINLVAKRDVVIRQQVTGISKTEVDLI